MRCILRNRCSQQTYSFTRNLIETVSPNSLRQTRWQVYRDLHRDIASSVQAIRRRLLESMMREPDYKEGRCCIRRKAAAPVEGGPTTK